MRVTRKYAVCFLACAGLAGCAPTPENLETEPVEVMTSKGIVTCQLYTKELLLWDRSIDRPETMSLKEADAICKEEGARQE